jgi:predicted nucleotidyltransferase
METTTGYLEEVQPVLVALSQGVESIFGENLVGTYLMGSLTYGDFNPGRSDIDLVVVLKKAASGKDIEQLKELHARVEKTFPVWKKRIESQYVPIDFFWKTLPPKEPRPFKSRLFLPTLPSPLIPHLTASRGCISPAPRRTRLRSRCPASSTPENEKTGPGCTLAGRRPP